MNTPQASCAQEINRLHTEVLTQTIASKKCLHAALVAAWQAGRLLLAEQARVRRTMGAAWGHWLKEKFRGSRRTAQNYMRLAETVADVAEFEGLSLRQVYLRLGIATEPKCRVNSAQVAPLPSHIRLANRLLEVLPVSGRNASTTPEAVRLDLRALYDRLRPYFEEDRTKNHSASGLTKRSHFQP